MIAIPRRGALALLGILAFVCVASGLRDYGRAAAALARFATAGADPGALSPMVRRVTRLFRHDVFETPVTFPLATSAGPVRARLYSPENVTRPPGLVLIHGVHRLGVDEPRLKNFAQTLASSGVVVLTPEIQELADFQVDPRSLDTVAGAVHELTRRLGARHVGLMGISFGGGLALVTAADPASAPQVAFVATVGAHHDLARVLRFFATHSIPKPDGSTLALHAHDYGPLVAAYGHLEDVVPTADVAGAREALRLWLWEDFAAARARAVSLSPEARATLEAFFEHHVESLAPRLLDLVARHEGELRRVSPSTVLPSLRVPVYVLHGAGDSVVPATEAAWIAHDVPPGLLRDVVVTDAVTHAELHGVPPARELWPMVRYLAGVLHQEDQARP